MISINTLKKTIELNGQEVTVVTSSRLMYNTMLYLAENVNTTKTRKELIQNCWEVEFVSDRTVDVVIRKIRMAFGQELIKTTTGVGYSMISNCIQIVGKSKKSKSVDFEVKLNCKYKNNTDGELVVEPLNFTTFSGMEFVVSRANFDDNFIIIPTAEFAATFTEV